MNQAEHQTVSTEAHRFTLYVAGDSPNSARAKSNLARLCALHLAGRHRIDIIDVLRDPLRALADGVIATPTVVRQHPSPTRTLFGDLSNETYAVAMLVVGAVKDGA